MRPCACWRSSAKPLNVPETMSCGNERGGWCVRECALVWWARWEQRRVRPPPPPRVLGFGQRSGRARFVLARIVRPPPPSLPPFCRRQGLRKQPGSLGRQGARGREGAHDERAGGARRVRPTNSPLSRRCPRGSRVAAPRGQPPAALLRIAVPTPHRINPRHAVGVGGGGAEARAERASQRVCVLASRSPPNHRNQRTPVIAAASRTAPSGPASTTRVGSHDWSIWMVAPV